MVEAKLVASWWRSIVVKCVFVMIERWWPLCKIFGNGPTNHHLNLKSQLRPWSLNFFIIYLGHRQLAWKKLKGAVPAQNINCFTWPRKKRVALGRQSFLRTPISLQSWHLTGFLSSDEAHLCIKTYAFAKSTDWILCIWLIHPKLIVLKSTDNCTLPLILFFLP